MVDFDVLPVDSVKSELTNGFSVIFYVGVGHLAETTAPELKVHNLSDYGLYGYLVLISDQNHGLILVLHKSGCFMSQMGSKTCRINYRNVCMR